MSDLKILLHGLNYWPEEVGIGKYSGEMVADWVDRGCEVHVVTTPPYYPQWEIGKRYSGWWYRVEGSGGRDQGTGLQGTGLQKVGSVSVIRCPLWVPKRVNGLKRVLHLASFGLSSLPVVLYKAIRYRPDVVITVEPAAFCMPTSWLAARLTGAKAWLHVQDFEVDAAFELGILRHPLLKKLVLWMEAFLMRRFDRVSTISPPMVERLQNKGVPADRSVLFPNWVDCETIKPLDDARSLRPQFGLPEDKCIALYAGNIGAKQGLEIIVDAAKGLQHRTDLLFVICGHGAAFPSIQAAAEGVSNIRLLSVQPLERFNELMNAADIHLLPQRGDAADLVMPSKLTGMLASGRPVVACATPGTQIADVVSGCGIVVPPGDEKAFAAAIVVLAEDEAKRTTLGAAARSYAYEHLGKEAILDRFFKRIITTMPIYEFYCKPCHTVYSFLARSSAAATQSTPACPKCGTKRLEKQVSRFAISKGLSEGAAASEHDPFANVDESKMEALMSEMASTFSDDGEGDGGEDPRQMAQLMRKMFETTGMQPTGAMLEAMRRMESGEDPDKIDEEMGDILDVEEPMFAGENSVKGRLRRIIEPPNVDPELYDFQ